MDPSQNPLAPSHPISMQVDKPAATASVSKPATATPSIEDLPLSERLKCLETFDWFKGISPGRLIDSKDEIGQWCVAEVLSATPAIIEVSYDGWSSKYEQKIRANSSLLAPFRLNTKGYTGAKKCGIRYRYKYSLDMLKEKSKEVDDIIASNFACLKSANEVTVSIRGRLYILLDFVMSKQTDQELGETVLIMEYITGMTKMLAKYLQFFKENYISYFESQNYPKLFLIDRNVALAACFYEVFDMLNWLFGGCERTKTFYYKYDKFEIEFSDKLRKDKKEENSGSSSPSVPLYKGKPILHTIQKMTSTGMESTSNKNDLIGKIFCAFCMNGGMDAIYDILLLNPKQLISSTPFFNKQLSFYNISQILAIFIKLRPILSSEFLQELCEKGKQAYMSAMAVIDDKIIRDLSNEQLVASSNQISSFLRLGESEESIAKLIETVEMQVSLKLLQSQYFEKRIQGISEINGMITRLEQSKSNIIPRNLKKYDEGLSMMQKESSPTGSFMNKSYSPDNFITWVLNNMILEAILNDNAHAELIKRSAKLFKFLTRRNALSKNMIDLLWKCQQDKYEDIVLAIYDVIKVIIDSASMEIIYNFFEKLKTVELKKYDEKLVAFMKSFTLAAFSIQKRSLEKHEKMKDLEPPIHGEIASEHESTNDKPSIRYNASNQVLVPNDIHLFCLPLLWNAMLDEAVMIDFNITNLCREAASEILRDSECKDFLQQYLYASLENVKLHKSVPQSLYLIKVIFEIYLKYIKKNRTGNNGIETYWISKASIDFHLIELTMTSIEIYKEKVDKIYSMGAAGLKSWTGNVLDYKFIGKYSHRENIHARLEFFGCIMSTLKELNFSAEQFNKLFTIFVNPIALSESSTELAIGDAKAFLNWLSQPKQEQDSNSSNIPKYYHINFTKLVQNSILSLLYSNRDLLCSRFCDIFFQCFIYYFIEINKAEKLFEEKHNIIMWRADTPFVGNEFIWNIIRFVPHEKIRNDFSEILIQLYLENADIHADKKGALYNSFVEKCMKTMQECEKSGEHIGLANYIKLLKLFFDTLEGAKYNFNIDDYSSCHTYKISIILKPENITKVDELPYKITLGQVRKIISDSFKIPFQQFQLSSKNHYFDKTEYHYTLQQLSYPSVLYVQKLSSSVMELNNPKYLLAQNKEYTAQLFGLLSKEYANYASIVWELLMSLPRNQIIQAQIMELSQTEDTALTTEQWSLLLGDITSIYRLMYSLQIINDIISEQVISQKNSMKEIDPKEKSRMLWFSKFSKKGGINHLAYCLLNLSSDCLEQLLGRKCLSLLIHLLNKIKTTFDIKLENVINDYESKKPPLLQRVLEIILSIAHASNSFNLKTSALSSASKKKIDKSPRKRELEQEDTKGEDDGTKEMQNAATKATMVKFKEESSPINDCLNFIKTLNAISAVSGKSSFNSHEIIVSNNKFRDLIIEGCVGSDNLNIRIIICNFLVEIYVHFMKAPLSKGNNLSVVMALLFNEILPEVINTKESNAKQFMEMLFKLIELLNISDPMTILSESSPLGINFKIVSQQISQMIINKPTKESIASDTDVALVGLIKLLLIILKKLPLLKLELQKAEWSLLVPYLAQVCLFDFPKSNQNKPQSSSGSPSPPKCKSTDSREAAYDLLFTLCMDVPENIKALLKILVPLHRCGMWRTKREADWGIAPVSVEKSDTGYVGLLNLGATCYMNSLIQQLFMIPSFRLDILAIEDSICSAPQLPTSSQQQEINRKPSGGPATSSAHLQEDNLLFQTQCLFATLRDSTKQYYNPIGFCKAFKDWEGRPINTREQMDADEFFNLFMDKLETQIKGSVLGKTIQYHFGGKFVNQLIPKECIHSSAREEPFLSINLQVKNKRSLQQCLDSFVLGEMLQGHNAYLCEKCEKKVTTLKRVCIKKLPKYLIFVLKRFEYDYDSRQKIKINDYCEFPMRLNMEPYTEEGLLKADLEKEKMQKKDSEDLISGGLDKKLNATGVSVPKYPREYYEYKLNGAVIHSGTADSGHYVSVICDREKAWLPENQRWYEFNDMYVDEYDVDSIAKDAYGGEEQWSGYEGFTRKYEKIKNAYLLVYDRVSSTYEPPLEEGEEEHRPVISWKSGMGLMKDVDLSQRIHRAVVNENMRYWQNKYFFSTEYLNFARDLCMSWNSKVSILTLSPCRNMDYHLMQIPTPSKAKIMSAGEAKKKLAEQEKLDVAVSSPTELVDLEFSLFKYLAIVFLTTILRSNDFLNRLADFMDLAKAHINKNLTSAKWLLLQFSHSKVFEEFFFECPHERARMLICGLLYCCMLKISTTVGVADEVLANFIRFVITEIGVAKKNSANSEQYFQLISRIAFIGKDAKSILITQCQAIRRLLEFIKNPANKSMADTKDITPAYKKPDDALIEIGFSVEVDDKFRFIWEEFFAVPQKSLSSLNKQQNVFLYESLGLLFQSISLSQHPVPETMLLPVDTSIRMLLADTRFLFDLVHESYKNRISFEGLIKGIACLCATDINVGKPFIQFILSNLSDGSDYEHCKAYICIICIILGFPKQIPDEIFTYTIQEYDNNMKKYNKFFFNTFQFCEYLLIINQIPIIRKHYCKNREVWKWIFSWIAENPGPNSSPSSSVKPILYSKNHPTMIPQDTAKCRDNLAVINQKLKIISEQPEEEIKMIDPFEIINGFYESTIYYKKIYAGDQLKFKIPGNFSQKSSVIKALDELVQVSTYGGNNVSWIETTRLMVSLLREEDLNPNKEEIYNSYDSDDMDDNADNAENPNNARIQNNSDDDDIENVGHNY